MGCALLILIFFIVAISLFVIAGITFLPPLLLWLLAVIFIIYFFDYYKENNKFVIAKQRKYIISITILSLAVVLNICYCGASKKIGFLNIWHGCGEIFDDSVEHGMCKKGEPLATWRRNRVNNRTIQSCPCQSLDDCYIENDEKCVDIFLLDEREYKFHDSRCLTTEDIDFFNIRDNGIKLEIKK
ncbi:MAG: hypothetical protein GF349_01540 [Candidatus Magasanikbacteria bacterium]|nr:hypothetical protein [Candidatus Magasanikbacteria bacterium]